MGSTTPRLAIETPDMGKRVGLHVIAVAALAAAQGCNGSSAPVEIDGAPAWLHIKKAATTDDGGPRPAPPDAAPPDAAPREPRCRPHQVEPIEGARPAPPDVAAAPPDAEKTASGLASRVIRKGRRGKGPSPYDVVKVHFSGWTTDGVNFESTVVTDEPMEFRLNQVIKGWREGLQLMREGEKRRFWIPEELAYKGRCNRPQGMLVFDVELIKIRRAPPLPPVPENVSGPPPNAEKTASGLASLVLKQGHGTARPGWQSKVKVNYNGWETNGELFRSTELEGRPLDMYLGSLNSKGLSEGIQLMVEGERRRLWIPPELAYVDQPGAPAGMIVMDIELLQIWQ
jgi:peptidylprolyl isomerase